jgi:hypothetical protein
MERVYIFYVTVGEISAQNSPRTHRSYSHRWTQILQTVSCIKLSMCKRKVSSAWYLTRTHKVCTLTNTYGSHDCYRCAIRMLVRTDLSFDECLQFQRLSLSYCCMHWDTDRGNNKHIPDEERVTLSVFCAVTYKLHKQRQAETNVRLFENWTDKINLKNDGGKGRRKEKEKRKK